MCGICGIVGLPSQEEAAGFVRRMMAAMNHRGPDGEGQFVSSRAAIGMRRLSIIDLPGGLQPIWNETGTLAVIFNGEIYNFRELRRTLESTGHQFRTKSDTEVIVHAFEEWGEDCVLHLRGMFAFAILELANGKTGLPRRIFLARDRFGIKPLYYAIGKGVLLFASEVRALLASGFIPPRISIAAISSYLLFGSVGEPMTLVDGIWSVPPGHRGFISCDDPAAFRPLPYWNFQKVTNRESAAPEQPRATSIKSLLEDSVRHHLEADVPLGVFLSGGMDSTALATIAASQRPGIHTCTVIFSQQEFSEAEVARRTAQRLGTEHAELLLTGEEMSSRLVEALDAFDQPSMDGVNTFFVSWAARQAGLKVALSGLGSDEIFGGYDTFRTVPGVARLISRSHWLPIPVRRAAAGSLETFASRSARADAARKLAGAILKPEDFPHAYFFTRALFPPRTVAQVLHANGNSKVPSPWRDWLEQASSDASHLDSFTSVSWLETRSYLVNTLLRDTDTMSMRHSLEVRVPFLDHPLVEWTLNLPGKMKRKNGARKALLIEALGDLLPDEIVRQPKRTFTLPWEDWLRGPLRERVEASLSDLSPTLEPILEASATRRIWRDFQAHRTSWSRPWSLFVLNEWVRTNLEGAPTFSAQENARAAHAIP
jgi:asparagine synthase (glutamine-hydrolysing)